MKNKPELLETQKRYTVHNAADMAAIEREVLHLLGWSLEEHALFVYERGISYLDFYLHDDPDGKRLLEGQKLFWNWWKNNWYARNQEFVPMAYGCPLDLRIEVYIALHDPLDLSKEIKPSKIVLGEAFATQKV
jgi:hypothetical protein